MFENQVFTVVLAFTHGKEKWNEAQKHLMGLIKGRKATRWSRTEASWCCQEDDDETTTLSGVKGFPGWKGDEVHTDDTQGTGQEHASYSPESGQQGATQGSGWLHLTAVTILTNNRLTLCHHEVAAAPPGGGTSG